MTRFAFSQPQQLFTLFEEKVEKMEFYEVVKSRRTIRDFTNKKVDKEIIERILSAGLMAPTNDHLRNWEFVVITEKELIEKILMPIKKLFSDPKEVDFAIKSW